MNILQQISKHRTVLMGVAILWIVLYHSGFQCFPFCCQPMRFIQDSGYGGVDIFLFLSGFGLYYSSLKSESKLSFYRKRFFRIFPAYIIIVTLAVLIGHESASSYLYKVTTIGFWLNEGYFDWYVPSIVVLYLLFPFYIKLFNRKPLITTIFAIILGLIITFIFGRYFLNLGQIILLFLTRIPIFVIGIFIGKLSTEKSFSSSIMKPLSYILMLLGFAGLFYIKTDPVFTPYLWKGLHWLPFAIIVPGLILLLSSLFKRFYNKYIYKGFTFLGNICFELYLSHMLLFMYRDYWALKYNLNIDLVTFIFILISLPIAYFLNQVSNVVAKKCIRA
ncbi:MAG: acyltransferase [Dysgonomonas sp.]|nr:acyltransferase [Dysgonomonas sp.]